MAKLVTICLVVVGLINLVPVLGVVSAQKIESVYAVSLTGPDLAILMRHRALLFGILGAFTLYAAFTPIYQSAAMLMTGVSMIAFALLVISTKDYNAAIGKVLTVDLIGIVFLLIAALLKYLFKTN